MKVWKKNLVAAAVLVAVCAGIYVNWLYTEEQTTADLAESLDGEKILFCYRDDKIKKPIIFDTKDAIKQVAAVPCSRKFLGKTIPVSQNRIKREIAEKLKRGRRRVAAQKTPNQENISVYSQYLSILAIGMNSMPLQELINLTIF